MRKKQLKERRTNTSWKADVVLLVGDCECWMEGHRYAEIREAVCAKKERTNQGEAFFLSGGGALVWMRRDDKGVLVHELMHVAWHILSSKGVPLTDDTQEAYCYLIEHLFERLSG